MAASTFDYEIFFNKYQLFVLIVPVRFKVFNLQQRLTAEWTP